MPTIIGKTYFDNFSVIGQPQSLKQKLMLWLSYMLTLVNVSWGINPNKKAKADWNVLLYLVLYMMSS